MTSCLTGLTGSTSGISTNSATEEAADNLTDSESDLYESEDGTFSIPVTIAKLESVNALKLEVEMSDRPGVSGTVEADDVAFLTKAAEAEDDGVYTTSYHFIGEAGAVNTDEADEVMLINGDWVSRHAVNSDGSFEVYKSANEGDPVAILPVNSSNQGGPPIVAQKENDLTTISFTNTDYMNIYQYPIMERNYYYFSVKTKDDTFILFRRHMDGKFPQVIAKDLEHAPRVITVSQADDVVMATQDGKIYYIQFSDENPDKDMSVGIANFLVAWNEPVEIMDIGESLNLTVERLLPASIQLFFSDSENAVFLAANNYISSESTEPQEYLLRYYDLDTDEDIGLIDSLNYKNPIISKGAGNVLYVFLQPQNSLRSSLFRVMMNNGAKAWDNRYFLYEHEVGADVVYMASSRRNAIMFADLKGSSHTDQGFYHFDLDNHVAKMFMEQNVNDEYIMTPWLVVSPLSEFEDSEFISCTINSTEIGHETLVYGRVMEGDLDNIYTVASNQYGNSCSGYYTIDAEGRLVFYRAYMNSDGSMGKPQLSVFDVYSLDPDLLPLVD